MANWWDEAPLVAGGDDWWSDAPVVEQEPGFLDKAQQLLRQGVETATFGLVGDEANAWFQNLTGQGDSYDSELARERANEAQMRQAHPYLSLGADLTGAVAPALLGLGAISGARTLGSAAAIGAGLGATAGGTQGFMEGEGGLGDRLQSGGVGALIGGGLGAAAPVAGAGVRRGYEAASDMLRNRRVGSAVGQSLGVSNRSGQAIAELLTPEDPTAMRTAIAAAGPDAMLADASGTTGGVLDALMRTPTPGARIANDRVSGRAAAAGNDIMDAINPMQGPRQPIGAAMDAIRTGTAGARQTAYDAAYGRAIDYASNGPGRQLLSLQSRLPARAVSYANELMRLRGEKSPQILANIADDGSVSFQRLPDVRQWDYIKQALDQLAESGDGAGALGGQTRLGAAYQSLARDVRDNLAAAVPEYRTALDTASDAISRRNAVQFGSEMLSPRTTTEEAMERIATATGPDREAMRTGVRGQMEEVIGNVRAVASDQNVDARQALAAYRDLSSPNARRKMEALFGDDWPAISEQLDRAGAALGLRARTSANSATFGRTEANNVINALVEPSALRRGQPVQAARDFAASMMGASPDAVVRMRRGVQSELADVLTQPGNAEQQLNAVLQALTTNPKNMMAGQLESDVVRALLLGSAGNVSTRVQDQLGLLSR